MLTVTKISLSSIYIHSIYHNSTETSQINTDNRLLSSLEISPAEFYLFLSFLPEQLNVYLCLSTESSVPKLSVLGALLQSGK